MNWVDILIIGGGAAGLSLGFELKRRGLPFVILEKAAAGESWRRMPTNLRLVSPWKANYLPGTLKSLHPSHYQMSSQEFAAYLESYAQEYRLPIQNGVEVRDLTRNAEGLFQTRTSDGDYVARLVVNATGYFCNPIVPEIPGAGESKIPQLHVAEYRDPVQLRDILKQTGTSILIIGKRLSAGQTMVELVEAGFEVALSHRSRIKFGAEPLLWWFLYRVFPWMEWLRLKVSGPQAASPDVRMQGGQARRLIQSGRVKTFPAIARFEGEKVIFENGKSLCPGLVIYATGFRSALQHLGSLGLPGSGRGDPVELREFESIRVPGLFFLGLDRARNFQSRFLRGIRKDAGVLADRLEALLTSSLRGKEMAA